MTIQHFIVTGFRYVWKNIRKSVFFIYDKIFSVDFTCSLADILSLRKTEITPTLYITASRVLDIKGYEKSRIADFPYQITLRKLAKGDKERLNIAFEQLILSIEKEGYISNSKVFVDKNIHVFDGTHRLGVLFYKGLMEVPVRCVKRKSSYYRNIDIRLKKNIPPQMLEDILQECTCMQQTFLERGYSFVLWISGGEESEIRHLLFGLTPFIDVYKTYAVASNATQYDGGFLVQFTPKNLEYAVTRKGYYAKNVKRMESILSKRIANLGWNQRFAISQNCLEGHKMMETVQAFLKEVE